jgi:hypothetical protein
MSNSNKLKPVKQTGVLSQSGMNLEFFLGTNPEEQITSLDQIKHACTDILLQFIQDDCSLGEATVRIVTQLYVEAHHLSSRIKLAA